MVLGRSFQALKETLKIGKERPVALCSPLCMAVVDLIVLFLLFSIVMAPYIYGERFLTQSRFVSVVLPPLIVAVFVVLLTHTFFSTAHSWIIYRIYKKKPVSFMSALRVAAKDFKDVITLTVLGFVVSLLVYFLKKDKSFIKDLLGFTLEHSWSIVYKFTLPAMVIKDQSVWDALRKDVPKLLNAVPEALIGEFVIEPLSKAAITIGAAIWFFVSFLIMFFLFAVNPYLALTVYIGLIMIYLFFTLVIYLFIRITYFTILYIWLKETKTPSLVKMPPVLKKIRGK